MKLGIIATAALILGVINFARQSARPTPPAPTDHPVFGAVDQNAAKEHVCEAFTSVVPAVRTATNAPLDGPEPIATSVNGRAALVIAALVISRSVSPATPPDLAHAATALADAYSHYLLTAFTAGQEQ